jgi:predicted transposase/invertase (TIGR01784 family)
MEYNKCNLNERRLYLFGCKDIEEIKRVVTESCDENQIIVSELERLKMDGEFLASYDNEIVQKHMMEIEKDEGYNEGFDKGFDSGKKEQNIEIVKESLLNGLDIDIISKITKLSKEEINKIIKDNNIK